MGNITIQGDLTGDVPGGEVGGASNLTTVGAIPYVSAAGILNQDPTGLFWDATNNFLYAGVYTNPSTYSVRLGTGNNEISIRAGAGTIGHSGANMAIGSAASMSFNSNSAERARFATTTGNLLIGTSTDSNFKLDVATSGSAGTARFYDQASPLGSTKVVVRAGAGQSTTNLQEWQDSSGNLLLAVVPSGALVNSSGTGALTGDVMSGGGTVQFGNTAGIKWSGNSGFYTGTKDLSLSRASAGVLQVGDGGSNANGVVSLTRSQHAGVLVANLPAAAAGNAGSIQYVTDANATTIGSTVAGGGANKVMVWSDGAAWKIFAS